VCVDMVIVQSLLVWCILSEKHCLKAIDNIEHIKCFGSYECWQCKGSITHWEVETWEVNGKLEPKDLVVKEIQNAPSSSNE